MDSYSSDWLGFFLKASFTLAYAIDFQDVWVRRAGFDYPILDREDTLGGDVAGDSVGVIDVADLAVICANWLKGR